MPERVKYPFRKTKPFSAIQLEEVSTMLSMKKQRGLGNKPNAAQQVETEDLFFFFLEKMWSLGAIGLQNPRSLLRMVCGTMSRT